MCKKKSHHFLGFCTYFCLAVYNLLLWIATPFLFLLILFRILVGKEDWRRTAERFGISKHKLSQSRPVIWVHVASVGEYNAIRKLLAEISQQYPDYQLLVTSITRTSASLALKDMNKGANWLHQYAPFDHPLCIHSFLYKWQPVGYIGVESEIWPVQLSSLKRKGSWRVLVNARMSNRSFSRWQKIKSIAVLILSHFDLILTQSVQIEQNFALLLSDTETIKNTGNLKFDAAAPQLNQEIFSAMKEKILERPLLNFVSTHQGEEEIALKVFPAFKAINSGKNSLLVIAPRHPERAEHITQLCLAHSLKVNLRSKHHLPSDECDVFIWDTIGELGIVYRLSSYAIIGGSLISGGGGHNAIEAIECNCLPIYGPYVDNFKQLYKNLKNVGAAIQVEDAEALKILLKTLHNDKEQIQSLVELGHGIIKMNKGATNRTLVYLHPYLNNKEYAI